MCVWGVTLSKVIPHNNSLLNTYFENLTIGLHYIFYILLTCILIFMPIGCYLPFDP